MNKKVRNELMVYGGFALLCIVYNLGLYDVDATDDDELKFWVFVLSLTFGGASLLCGLLFKMVDND